MQPVSQVLKRRIPWLMAGTRAALGPVVMMAELAGWTGVTLAWMVLTGLLSDIFDGVLARRWKCDTAAVRLFDSMADIVFYLGCAVALAMSQPQLSRSFAVPVAIVLGLEALKLVFDFVKFGKPTSYHTYLAKTWGLVLAITVVMSFAMHAMIALHIAWWIALALGVVYCLEGLTISLIMPEWRHDLKTLPRALNVRRQILLERSSAAGQPPASHGENDGSHSLRVTGTVTVMMILLVATTAHASSIPSVTFLGGTATITTGAAGTIDIGADQLTFQWSGGSLAIPYTQIHNFSYREKGVNLGVLPFIAVVLVHPQPQRHILSITYLDASGQKQVAIFQVPKQARDTLPVVLQERTGVCSDQYALPCRPANSVHTSQRTQLIPIPLLP